MGNLIAGSVESTPSGHGIIEELKKKKKKDGGRFLRTTGNPRRTLSRKLLQTGVLERSL